MGGGAPGRRAGPELEAAWAWGAAEGRMWPGAPVEAGLGLGAEGQSCVLGHCSLGLHASGSERSHWEEMLKNPRRQIAMWHQLHL